MNPSTLKISEEKVNFKERNVLIVGDVILDKYVIGSVKRISPEAPVPVVRVTETKEVLGGAANVAHNVVSLGGHAHLVGLVGDDKEGEQLKQLLSEFNISSNLYDALPYTISKTRLIGEHQQMVRIDSEPENFELTSPLRDEIFDDISQLISEFHCLVISDYAKGLLATDFTQNLIALANSKGIQTIVDPKGNNWSKYRKATLITPNLKELSEVSNIDLKNEDAIVVSTAKKIIKTYKLGALLVTRSENGMSHVSKDIEYHADTTNKEVYDVSGAGDTVVSMISLTASSSYSISERLLLANAAAGIVVGKVGTASVTIPELLNQLSVKPQYNVISREEVVTIVDSAKKNRKTVVFTNGCFDILHKGHIEYLEKAKAQGDILVLGLNSDASVRRLKGESRPINNEIDRAFMLLKLGSVDYVTVFEEDTPLELIKLLKPDVLAKGADYSIDEVVGREYAKEVRLIDFVDGYSTSSIINKSKGH